MYSGASKAREKEDFMDTVGIKHTRSPEVKKWMKKETDEQKARYKEIVAEMDALAPKRDRWVEDFFKRIQTRGFNVDGDMVRKIKPTELPKKPNRKFKVVF
jgi:hypothetical protein